ncbi:hypothetical protein NKH17_32790 [Mesorhizobium sp. M1334]|uniref:hypothetical protein n=1 Tax=Mesorhizobium sp. M1334 TaxID=2957084 RepID=UPI003334E6AA
MRPKERHESGQTDLLRSRLDQILNMDHALVKTGPVDRLAHGCRQHRTQHRRLSLPGCAIRPDSRAGSGLQR